MHLVNQYCLSCHNNALVTAELSVQSMDFANSAKHVETMERMVKKLRAHMMPASNLPRPPFEAYEIVNNRLKNELDGCWAVNPNSGRVAPVHRKNRYEYSNLAKLINARLPINQIVGLLKSQ